MRSWDLINRLIEEFGYERYLEIGVFRGLNIRKVKAKVKVGVDPFCPTTYKMTSDDFFKMNTEPFDIVFVDGLHTADQAYRDIINSLEILSYNGTIVVHDLNPRDESWQVVPRIGSPWTGDVWKAWVNLRQSRSDLSMCVVDMCRHGVGCGVIRRGTQTLLDPVGEMTWESFDKNRKKWLNLVSPDEFFAS